MVMWTTRWMAGEQPGSWLDLIVLSLQCGVEAERKGEFEGCEWKAEKEKNLIIEVQQADEGGMC